MKREGIAALALIVVIVAMMFTGCRGMNESSSSSSITQVKVVVDCNGTWTGNIGALNSQKSINGTGHQEYTLDRGNVSIFLVSALAQKADASDGILTGSIEDMNGTVVRTENTSAAYGVASVWALVSYQVTQSGMSLLSAS